MEDEQCNLISTISNDGVSELHVNVSDESLLVQMSVENPVEDSCVVEDGGEIMVENVGSDVFIDGMRLTNDFNCAVLRDLEVKCSESGEVPGVSTLGNEMVDDNGVKDPKEAVVIGEIGGTDVKVIKDEGTTDKVSVNIVTFDQLNDSVEAFAEGETGIAMVVTEGSTVKSEAVEKNSSNNQKNEISQVKVADSDKPSENGEGIDMEHFEQQGNATLQELLAHAVTVCPLAYDAENQLAENYPDVDAELGLDNLVEENGSPRSKELEVSSQKTEMEHEGVDIPENVEVPISTDEIIKYRESEEDSSKSNGNLTVVTLTSETKLMNVKKDTGLDQEYHEKKEVDAETEEFSDQVGNSHRRKAWDPLTDGPEKRVNFNAANTSASTDQTPKHSFKIGECILRVASQLTVVPPMMVNEISTESSSVIDMLSQLQLVAQDPNKPHRFRNEIITFFSGFRSSVVASKRVRKRKFDKSVGEAAEEFEFHDAKDSYWTDRIVQNSSEKESLHNNENGEINVQLAVPVNGAKPEKSGRKPQSRKKRYFTGHIPDHSDEFEEKAKQMKQETSPAELILNFAERKCVPSEINVNKMFRRFGPLLESETEVDYESGRARVIFKRGSDAEVAHSSSLKFNIFGPVLVNYQIGYSPLISVKVSPLI